MTSEAMKPPADCEDSPRAVERCGASVVVEGRAGAAVLGEQRMAAVADQVQEKHLVGLFLAVGLDLDRDGLRRLARGEGQRAGPGEVSGVAGRGRACPGAQRQCHRTAPKRFTRLRFGKGKS